MRPIVSSPCETASEELNAGDHDPGFGAGDGALEVLGEPPITAEPGEGAFDHPAARLRLEGAKGLGSGDDLDRPLAEIAERAKQLGPAIDPISEDIAQARKALSERSQQRDGAMIVLNVGRMHQQRDERALCVGDDVTLAPLDTLGGVKPAWATAFCRLHALAVDDPGGRRRVASDHLANQFDQRVVDPVPRAIIAPAIEESLHSRARRELLWQGSPLTACRQTVQNR